ncbi:MAG TPA: cytochrome c [Candidatus Angelobacter sp.]|nr:cytochrome c [Candidatus Angelobacter sp.]
MRQKASILIAVVFLVLLAGCGKDPEQQTDAELGLTPQQAQGRRVFHLYCAVCHSAYSSKGLKGPSMKGLYKKEYLPSGLIANDQFVEQTIVRGRNMMPQLGTSLTQQQVEDLIVYLHTL